MARTLGNLGFVDSKQNRPDDARQHCEKTIKDLLTASNQSYGRYAKQIDRIETILELLRYEPDHK